MPLSRRVGIGCIFMPVANDVEYLVGGGGSWGAMGRRISAKSRCVEYGAHGSSNSLVRAASVACVRVDQQLVYQMPPTCS